MQENPALKLPPIIIEKKLKCVITINCVILAVFIAVYTAAFKKLAVFTVIINPIQRQAY